MRVDCGSVEPVRLGVFAEPLSREINGWFEEEDRCKLVCPNEVAYHR
jgi:hypothetical protein